MSISSVMTTALSGLAATGRAAEVVSSNISNALTEGYGRRELEVSARALGGVGGGVEVDAERRVVDKALLGDLRLSDAALGEASKRAGFWNALERAAGTPDAPGSLSGRVAALESALVEAGSRPDSQARLARVAETAAGLAEKLSGLSDEVQQTRMEAESGIARAVDRINDGLGRVADLNEQILRQVSRGRQPLSLMDKRQQAIDVLAREVPLRVREGENGQVALHAGGAVLLEGGRSAQLGFAPAGRITADMTRESGALAGLTLDGRPVATGADGPLSGGALAARFALRDDLAVTAQAGLDGLAHDLVARFEAPQADPTRPPGAPGLFTDAGAALDPARTAGLASRLELNAAVDPDAGGALWRLRDGLGATAPGPVGDGAGLSRLAGALGEVASRAGAAPGAPARSFAGHAGAVLSDIGVARLDAEDDAAHAAGRSDSLRGMLLEKGVDTDSELQKLLTIERAYAANARVLQTADDMLRRIMEI